MTSSPADVDVSQADSQADGALPFSKEDREKLLRPYLPAPRKDNPSTKSSKTRLLQLSCNLSSLFTLLLHRILFHLIQVIISIYVRLRQSYHALHDRILSILYYHHRTPELVRRDVANLSRLPRHLSVIVDLKDQGTAEAIQKLIGEAAELASWCACVGIEKLSVYERTGALKSQIPKLHHVTLDTLTSYFPRQTRPEFHIRAPNRSAYSPSPSPSRSPSPPATSSEELTAKQNLDIVLLSSSDGRDTLVDLTKTITEMSQKGKLTPADVTIDLIHAEIEESCGFGEPDILVVMTGSANAGRDPVKSRRKGKRKITASQSDGGIAEGDNWNGNGLCLMGYPPWQVRLTEIFQVQDSTGIGYQIFLRALHRYAKAEMRFGR